MSRLILASRSPQRSAILERIGIRCEVRPPDAAELTAGIATETALENAIRKARVVERADGEDVLAADTVVELDGLLYHKPADEREARATLATLSGRTHNVHTGIALLLADGEARSAVASTAVTFRPLTHEVIELCVASGQWRGRAGGYAIQGLGALLVTEVRGEYENVVGLPVATLIDLWPQILLLHGRPPAT